ncbi:DUF192 domain-containing protein [Patescibacteria group bacterium]|nr:DUF192 domain-containing protein [Patescibacteria group bacterium]
MKQLKKIIIGCGIFLAVVAVAGISRMLFVDWTRIKGHAVEIDGQTFHIEIATTSIEQARGLSGRASLAPDAGMLFVFSGMTTPSFWMHGMEFPLDIIWISEGKIVGIAKDLPPAVFGETTIYTPPQPVDQVLEINAGLSDRYGFRIGDAVNFR